MMGIALKPLPVLRYRLINLRYPTRRRPVWPLHKALFEALIVLVGTLTFWQFIAEKRNMASQHELITDGQQRFYNDCPCV
jgi:hypothetical protein